MRKQFFIYLFFVTIHSSYATVTKVDSLLSLLNDKHSEKEQIDLYNDIAEEYIHLDNNLSFDYALKAIDASNRINYSEGLLIAYNTIAINERNRGNYSSALEYLKKALVLSQSNVDQTKTADCLISIGDVYTTLKNYSKSISHYEQAYKIYKKYKDKENEITSLSRIGNRNMDIGKQLNDTLYFVKAINIYESAKNLATLIGDQSKVILMDINLADAYNILGEKTSSKYHIFHSIDYSLMAIKLSRANNIGKFEAISYLNLGESYEKLGVISKAIHHYEIALAQYERLNDVSWLINIYKYLANSYYKLDKNDYALMYLERGVELAVKQNSKADLRDYFEIYSKIYERKKDYKNSLYYYQKYALYKDSILNENASINVARLQTELDIVLKDNQIELLTKNAALQENELRIQNIQRNSLIAAIIGVLILLLILFMRYRDKQKSEQQILKAKNIAEQAKEVQELFLANTSHEIRTPMNGIIGMTHQLQDTDLDKEQQEYVNAIAESSAHLLTIINDLLDLSKIRAGKMEFEKRAFKLGDVFKNLRHNLEYRSSDKNIDLHFIVGNNVPKVLVGDPVRLSQMLLNLAGNALKFTESGSVTIRADLKNEDQESATLVFEVKDTGIGIPHEKLKTIFESFAQVNSKTTKKYAGTGLGLSITKDLVEQQGGSISVESTVGVGSTFTIVLNFQKDQELLSEYDSSGQKQEGNLGVLNKLRVLVVDDNKINQKVAALSLKKWKAKVLYADDAISAIRIIKEKQVDLILMDVFMPEIDGLQATKIIREELKNSIPIIAITAAALIGEKEKCLAAGMNDYISKPFNPKELLEKIKKLVPTEKLTNEELVLDLTGLYQRADGDMEYFKDILNSYLVEMPLYLQEFKAFHKANDLHSLAAQAHKMRSPLALLGAKDLVERLLEVELAVKKGNDDLSEQVFSLLVLMIKQSISEVQLELQLLED
ncbi:MAG: response regulator [Bacteroidia bacterium]|nr:response regulator [Bacteroidia bacterium]